MCNCRGLCLLPLLPGPMPGLMQPPFPIKHHQSPSQQQGRAWRQELSIAAQRPQTAWAVCATARAFQARLSALPAKRAGDLLPSRDRCPPGRSLKPPLEREATKATATFLGQKEGKSGMGAMGLSAPRGGRAGQGPLVLKRVQRASGRGPVKLPEM